MKQPSLQSSSKFHSSSSWIFLALPSVCIISTSSRNPIDFNLIWCLIASTLLSFPYSNGFHIQFEMSSHRTLPPRAGISLASSLVPQDHEYPDDHPLSDLMTFTLHTQMHSCMIHSCIQIHHLYDVIKGHIF